MTSLDRPAYTYVNPELLRLCINSNSAHKTALLITTHGEIISSQTVTPPSGTELAMVYSGVPITVNYSDQSVNDQVLEVLDTDGHFAAIQAIGTTQDVKSELRKMATAMRQRDTMHTSERNSSVDEQAKDSWRSHYFSQSFPFTKIPDGIPNLRSIQHPNKRYTLRTFSDTKPEDDNEDEAHAATSLEKQGRLVLQYDDPKYAEVAHGNFEFKMNLFVPLPTGSDFNKHIQSMMAHGVVIVTKQNVSSVLQQIQSRSGSILGQGAQHVLNPLLSECILDNWSIILLPCSGNPKSREMHSYVMLPYRFHTLSGINCVVFDLWHLLCYQGQDSYSQNGLSMTTTHDYMQLLSQLSIPFVMGVDLTCNVVGTQEGGWPSLTIAQLNVDHAFQEHLFEWVTTRHSIRLSEDYLPHLYACKVELNNCINFIEDHTANQVLESLHPHIVFSHTVAYRGSSSFIETYRALSNFTKALKDHKQEDRQYLCLTTTPGHTVTAHSEEGGRLATAVLGDSDIQQFDMFIKHPYAEDKLSIHDIEELQKFLKSYGVRFDFTPALKGHLDRVSGDLTLKYKKISEHIAEEADKYGGVASKTYLLDERQKTAAREHEIQRQRAAGTVHGGPDLLTGRTPHQDRADKAKMDEELSAIKAQRNAERKARRDAEQKDAELVADRLRDERKHNAATTAPPNRYDMRARSMSPPPPPGGGSRKNRRTRRHRLKKRTSKRSLTSRNNRRLRKRSHTRRRR